MQSNVFERVSGDTVVSALARAGVEVVVAGAVVYGGYLVVRTIYNNLKPIEQLSEDDYIRYTKLLEVWNEHFPGQPIPDDWTLNNKKPTGMIDFAEQGLQLKKEAKTLRKYSTPNHEVRSMMLAHISNLFNSISKRSMVGDLALRAKYYMVRADGIESMFYIVLSNWLLKNSPNLIDKSTEALAAYKQQLDYCKAVKDTVFSNYKTEKNRNNPHSTLERIIDLLQNHYDKLLVLHHARSYNDLIKEIDRHLLGLAGHSLTILYLLIDSAEGDHFMIDKFSNPNSTDHKISKIRRTELGEWLHLTLQMAGLNYSKLDPSRPLSLLEIAKHLEDRHPDDPNFIKSKLNWGNRPFTQIATTHFPDGLKKSHFYLEHIRVLHRLTLELYYVSQSSIKSSVANENFGADLMFGNTAGKATLTELLSSIREASDTFISKFHQFWSAYYYDDFIPRSKKNHYNNMAQAYQPIFYIETELKKELEQSKSSLDALMDQLEIKSMQYASNSSKIEHSKLDFMSSVLSYREFHGKTKEPTYELAKKEYDRLRAHGQQRNTTKSLQSENPSHGDTLIPKENRLARALDCLSNRTPSDCIFSEKYQTIPLIHEMHFYSPLQQDVFETVIKKYNDLVNNRPNSNFWFGSLYYTAQKFSGLRYRYMCLFDAFDAFYSQGLTPISHVEMNEYKRENKSAIELFDFELTKFMSLMAKEELLFRADSHTALPDIISGKHDSIRIKRQDEGQYTVHAQYPFSELEPETRMSSIEERRANIKAKEDELKRRQQIRNANRMPTPKEDSVNDQQSTGEDDKNNIQKPTAPPSKNSAVQVTTSCCSWPLLFRSTPAPIHTKPRADHTVEKIDLNNDFTFV
ncbi:MAG: hypothetical protein CK424_06375 [Legionella sp.]|nr:MAG: hypothetical protein CK424_06375 [Legionella sp.]